jgi:hypothetical protein
MTYLIALFAAVLLIASSLPTEVQAQTNPDAQTNGTIYLPFISVGETAGASTVPTSDNPMTDLMAQHMLPTVASSQVMSAGKSTEIGPGLYALDGFDPNLPLDDLNALDKIVGNADFVGLGEPFHTNGGAYQMKHRIFRYLVEEKGFRVLSFESPFVWVERLDQYLQSCQVPATDALHGNLFSIFDSTEIADVVQWMCDWNQTHPNDRLAVYGFDMQRMARENGEAVIAFLQQLGIGADDPRVIGIRACDGVVGPSGQRKCFHRNAMTNARARSARWQRTLLRTKPPSASKARWGRWGGRVFICKANRPGKKRSIISSPIFLLPVELAKLPCPDSSRRFAICVFPTPK